MRKKFKIMYPADYEVEALRGKPFMPQYEQMVVMNECGVFFLYDDYEYYPSIRKLSKVLPKYDVIWKEGVTE